MDNDDLHPTDQWAENAKKAQADFLKQSLTDSSLVYQVFTSPAGDELLKRWMEVLIWTPTVGPNDDSITIGMNEGYKGFIRSIMQAIKTHEEQQ